MRLRDGTVLVGWRHGIAAINSELPTVWLDSEHRDALIALAIDDAVFDNGAAALRDALGDHLTEDGGHASIQAALAAADARVAGWIPGWQAHAQPLEDVQGMHARRRMLCPGMGSEPTLPSSTIRRFNLLQDVGPRGAAHR